MDEITLDIIERKQRARIRKHRFYYGISMLVIAIAIALLFAGIFNVVENKDHIKEHCATNCPLAATVLLFK